VVIHDAYNPDPSTAFAISRLTDAGVLHQSPIGIFREVSRPTYDDVAREQVGSASSQNDHRGELAGLIAGKDTWTVVHLGHATTLSEWAEL